MAELHQLDDKLSPDPQQTLYVFDIDNTLMRMKQDLGGDAWFTWQENLLKANPQDPDLVAPTLEGLVHVQGWLFAMNHMIAPEATTPEIIRELQQRGHPIFLLTSRGIEFEGVTDRELTRNGYDFEKSAPGPFGGYAERFIPYDLERPENACMTQEDMERMKLPPARPVIYRRGMMMTAGQHKGAMLRALVCRLGERYTNIVFVDDHQKHTDRVMDAYANVRSGEVFALRYGQMDVEVKAFHDGDKSVVKAQWQKLKDVIDEVFGKLNRTL